MSVCGEHTEDTCGIGKESERVRGHQEECEPIKSVKLLPPPPTHTHSLLSLLPLILNLFCPITIGTLWVHYHCM